MGDGISGFIDDILNSIGAGIDTVARKIWAAITSIWNVVTDFFWRILLEHSFLADIVRMLRNGGQAFMSHVFTTIKWLWTVAIPRFVQIAINTVTSWASNLINWLHNLIDLVYVTLLKWATELFNSIIKWLHSLENWAIDNIGRLWHDLRATISIVSHFLTDPAVIVEWFWDAAWRKARQWARSNEEALARWLWARAISGTVRMVTVLEDLIVRIL